MASRVKEELSSLRHRSLKQAKEESVLRGGARILTPLVTRRWKSYFERRPRWSPEEPLQRDVEVSVKDVEGRHEIHLMSGQGVSVKFECSLWFLIIMSLNKLIEALK